jgi:hypothetical protein
MAGGLVALCLVSSARADDTYRIRLQRPFKAGDTFDVSTTLKLKYSRKVIQGGVAKQDQGKDVEINCVLQGTENVTEVSDTTRQPTSFTFKIKNCTQDGKPLVPEGSTVTAAFKDGRRTVLVDGKPPADEIQPVLMALFQTNDPKDPSSDEQMGTSEPQKVGGSWEFKTDRVAKELQDHEQLPFDAADLKGTGTLNEVTKVDGKDVEKITYGIEGGFEKKDDPAIAGCAYHNASFKLQAVGLLPVDQTARPLSVWVTNTFSFQRTTPDSTIEVAVERTMESTITPAK